MIRTALATPVVLASCLMAMAWADDLSVSTANDAAAPAADGYKLVWSDEFDVDGPPRADNWRYERGFVRNQELQWYRPDNARCRGGVLVIEARRERVPNPRYAPNQGGDSRRRDWRRSRPWAEYTSACLTTRGLHQWCYGRLEMRARIDTRPGLWPAFWTLGSARPWPACGEVDIMEYYRGLLLANAAWQGERRTTQWDSTRWPIADFGDSDWSTKFHVWRMDWDRDAIRLLVDDQLLNEIDLTKTLNSGEEGSNPFHEPHFILLNLAIGGSQGGDPSATEFPARFEVDYVRVYQPLAANTAADQ